MIIKTIIGLDVSSSNIGYCEINDGRLTVYGCVSSKSSKIKNKRLCVSEMIREVFTQLADRETHVGYGAETRVVIELPKGKFKKQSASDMVHYAIGVVSDFVYGLGPIDICYITPHNWKRWFVNNAMSDKMTIQQEVQSLIGEFIEDDNIADAIGIAWTARQLQLAGIEDLYE